VFAGEKTEEGGSFYNLEDVFEMKEPGEYKVSLQLQAYERMYKGGQIFMFQLDRFEPFEFIVTKIAPRKANDFSLWVGMCVCPYKLFSRHPLENSKPKEFYRTPRFRNRNAPAMAENEKLLRQFRVFSVPNSPG